LIRGEKRPLLPRILPAPLDKGGEEAHLRRGSRGPLEEGEKAVRDDTWQVFPTLRKP